MKQSFPVSITPETFSQCWDYTERLRRGARVSAAVARIGGFFSNLLFLFSLLFGANGLAVTHASGSYCVFLKSLPFFYSPWMRVSGMLLKSDNSFAADLVILLLAAYLVSGLVFLLLAVMIRLFYHPRRMPLPAGTYPENTALLAKQTREARSFAHKTRITISIVSMVLVIAAAFALLFGYAVYILDAEKISRLLSRFPTTDAAANSMLYVLFGYFFCSIVTAPLLLITRPLYRFQIPYEMVVQAETAALLSSHAFPSDSGNQTQTAAALREEALTLEKSAAYALAKEKLHQSALLGDIRAMEHYARHCLLGHQQDAARYWLDTCISSGQATKEARNMLLRMKLKLYHNTEYLRSEGSLTLGQRRAKAIASLVLKLLAALLFVLLGIVAMYAAARYFGGEADLSRVLEELKALFSIVSNNLKQS